MRGAQNVFVNRRIVKDRTIAHAIIEAYSVATIKERSPEVHLFIRIPPDRVDVNVHPTKAEVRFLEQSLVHEVLRRALGEALGQGRAPELQFTPFAPRPSEPAAMTIPGVLAGATVGNRWSREPLGPWRNLMEPAASAAGTLQNPVRTWQNPQNLVEPGRTPQNPAEPDPIRPMIPLGQFRDTFIIAIDDEGIAIIDQHVAHERVLFEQVMEKLTVGPAREPAAAGADADRAVAGAAAGARFRTPRRSKSSAWRSRSSAATACGSRRCRPCSTRPSARPPCARLPRISRGSTAARGVEDAPAQHRRDDGLPCGGEGELSADDGEDAVHPRGAAPDRVFERLSARPPGRAADHAARDREELPADLELRRRSARHHESHPAAPAAHSPFPE